MKRILAATTLAVTLALGAAAQGSLSGKWQGETKNGGLVVLELTENGKKLTGTITRNKQAVQITDGKVSKNAISFKAKTGGRDSAQEYKGQVSGDEISLRVDRG